jgi:hypothetical protein
MTITRRVACAGHGTGCDEKRDKQPAAF